MARHVTITLTWPQLALVREVLDDFIHDDHVIYGPREVGLANRAIEAIFAAEHHPPSRPITEPGDGTIEPHVDNEGYEVHQ